MTPQAAAFCPACGTEIAFGGRPADTMPWLLSHLKRSDRDVRISAIRALGQRADPSASSALARLALSAPRDIWQAVDAIRALHQMPICRETDDALMQIRDAHPSAAVRAMARHVHEEMFTFSRGYADPVL
ncbi:HEAT repeat domain-containing protein [Chachezhania antarctica]|uniref:HEAT repeat domain-containing protein n=1 Tax=Chachezhania antarctica TaxID=2340860 RepID=UPI0013CF2E2D|nr:HEAT repeat domain-containing protein [Chachezhania antarctica]|tara:strand:+ start:9483 stop:9872 length:390 start_codon:yes stop_codon:yes gene_type:complete